MGDHYVPRAYLDGFSTAEGRKQVCQYDKVTRRFVQVSIRKAAQSPRYYSPTAERELARVVEQPANKVLRLLRQEERIQPADRYPLALYIGTLLKRVPKHRHRAQEMAPSVLTDVKLELAEAIRATAVDKQVPADVVSKKLGELEATAAQFERTLPPNVREIIENPWPWTEIVSAIRCMSWWFVTAPADHVFITTDNPVFFFRCYGLANRLSELTFPISNSLALFAATGPSKVTYCAGKVQLVKEANRRLASEAHRFVYSNDRHSWVPILAHKTRPYLSRIDWHC